MKSVIRATIFSMLLLWGGAQATVVSFRLDPQPNNISNDCVGYYNQGSGDQGFDSCVIFAEDDSTRTDISSIIAKFDTETKDADGNPVTCAPNQADCWTTSGNYPDFDASDLTLSYTGDGISGSWTYANDASVGIRFWVAKSSTGFIVFYDTDELGCSGAAASTFACMTAANVVYGGSWTTPLEKGLSHISFYDSEVKVPEPGTIALLGLGLLGMGLARRRQVRS